MARNNFFRFKQFLIIQEKAAMKVGIDGVLLGAWANFDGEKRVLDVGTGTGLLALMAAQRCYASIDAVELEPEAAAEALANFNRSAWKSRIRLVVCAFQDFEAQEKYDHIISNPPFFENSPKSADSKRAQARHSDSLAWPDLLERAKKMLAENGKISLILPADQEGRLRFLACDLGLYINRFCPVLPDETREPHRILAELSCSPGQADGYRVIIRNSESAEYTDQYRELTRDFYLAF
ncbi:tRNA1(Val) (adenine(37)-N6)-methyltransferase [Gaoshiqia sp. Z1-71]|uniref:tRNA1(Val) (adenine(37)-N6)-methyltransferase n=1 Tax=Gaoshiqia hydrogeniformans TaxID=3290090 RepID=UPI003BF81C10